MRVDSVFWLIETENIFKISEGEKEKWEGGDREREKR